MGKSMFPNPKATSEVVCAEVLSSTPYQSTIDYQVPTFTLSSYPLPVSCLYVFAWTHESRRLTTKRR